MMKNNKSAFDEMQTSKRDKIGNQTFFLMFYLLMLDIGLHGFGFMWLSYPMNVIVIIVGCTFLYLIRVIISNAYVPPKAQILNKSIVKIISSVALAAVAVVCYSRLVTTGAESNTDNSAIILTVISGVALLIVAVVSIIKKINNKKSEE